MLAVKARIYFVPKEEGGHKHAFSGIQPSMEIGDELVACKILKGEVGTSIALGVWHDVSITLGYGEIFEHQLKPGFKFRLMVGGWEIGNGELI